MAVFLNAHNFLSRRGRIPETRAKHELEGSPGNSTGECGCAGLLKLNYRDIADGVGLTAGFLGLSLRGPCSVRNRLRLNLYAGQELRASVLGRVLWEISEAYLSGRCGLGLVFQPASAYRGTVPE